MRKTKNSAAVALGKLGGPARARALSADRRRIIARMGGLASAEQRTKQAADQPHKTKGQINEQTERQV